MLVNGPIATTVISPGLAIVCSTMATGAYFPGTGFRAMLFMALTCGAGMRCFSVYSIGVSEPEREVYLRL